MAVHDSAVFQFLYGACKQTDEFKNLPDLRPCDCGDDKEKQRTLLIRARVMDLYLELSRTDDEIWTANLEKNLLENETLLSSPNSDQLRGSISFSDNDVSDKESSCDEPEAHDHDVMHAYPVTDMQYVAENRMEWLLATLTRMDNAMSYFAVRSAWWADAYRKFVAYKALVLRVVPLDFFPKHLNQQVHDLGLSGTGIFAIRFWESAVLVRPICAHSTSQLLARHSNCVAHLRQSRAMLSGVLIPHLQGLRLENPASRLFDSLRDQASNVLSNQMAKLRKLGSLGRHVEFEADDYTSRVLSEFSPDLHLASLSWTFTPVA
jgi:hypothetical protein